MTFPSFFPRIFRPPVYQGRSRPRKYFEGWYYKHVDSTGSHIWSIIFGISFSDDPHSFIQVIEGTSGTTDYIRFDKADFSTRRHELYVSIGPNVITEKYMVLDLEGSKFRISGRIDYAGNQPFPQKLLAPGIMGWYTYAPFMECYHGVVSMDHRLKGALEINGEQLGFTGGKGYIEKDWGRSMPSDWIWMQCNHFSGETQVSMMISIARIPWLNGFFPGFLSFVMVNGEVFRFATYNRSRIDRLEVDGKSVQLTMSNRRARLQVTVDRNLAGQLKAPVHGQMERKIAESLDATMALELSRSDGSRVFTGEGKHAGLEVVGDVVQYLNGQP